MSKGPKFYLDTVHRPRWLRVVGIGLVLAFLAGFFLYPSPLYAPIMLFFVLAQWLERIWKHQDEGFIKRADDPHIFWLAVLSIGAALVFQIFLFFDFLMAVLP
ncbi:hypothetical protein ACI5KX_04720 [Erythrobacter sp. GH1-10]|uniref:hypothetical protein n=1 Tax=Erythrobacter sp. GH1-10 TaxID=3349334 RepID=UPI0038779E24